MEKEIFQIVIRSSKEDSSFIYFILESNEGISFYSTLPFEPHTSFRDIEINSTIEFKENLLNLLDGLQKKCPFEILTQKIIS